MSFPGYYSNLITFYMFLKLICAKRDGSSRDITTSAAKGRSQQDAGGAQHMGAAAGEVAQGSLGQLCHLRAVLRGWWVAFRCVLFPTLHILPAGRHPQQLSTEALPGVLQEQK